MSGADVLDQSAGFGSVQQQGVPYPGVNEGDDERLPITLKGDVAEMGRIQDGINNVALVTGGSDTLLTRLRAETSNADMKTILQSMEGEMPGGDGTS